MKYGRLIKVFCLLAWSSITTVGFATSNNTYAAPNQFNSQMTNSSAWHFTIIPYLWFTWVNGNTAINGMKADVNATPRDILDALDAALLLHLEAAKDKWTLLAEPTYLKFDKTTNNIRFEAKQTLVDFGIYRQLMEKRLNGNKLTGDAFLGGRYWYMDGKLSSTIAPIATQTKREEWVDPVIGGRIVYRIGDKWLFGTHGDIGGFGIESHFTWLVKLTGMYKFNQYLGAAAGFRALGVDYGETHKFKYDIIQYGPTVGLVITF